MTDEQTNTREALQDVLDEIQESLDIGHAVSPRHFQARELLYPSNMLSLLRLLLLPITIWYLRQPGRQQTALFYMGLAMFTDVIDGPIARARNEVSNLGKMLDPVIDKLMLNSTAITLSQKYGLPWWITALFLARDVGILLAAAILLSQRKGYVVQSQPAGKSTTVLLTIALMSYLVGGSRIGKPLLYLTLVSGVVSVVQYGSKYAQLTRDLKRSLPDCGNWQQHP